MKKIRKYVLCSLIVTLVVSSTTGVLAVKNYSWFQSESKTDVYTFPITAESRPDEWKKLQSHKDMEALTQVPEDILKKMSTKGLVETCLSYPMFGDMFAYNSYIKGLDAIKSSFNGFRELSSRSDAAIELLNFYQNIDYDLVVKSNDPYYTLRIKFLDYYMSQDEVLLNLSIEERNELLNACIKAIDIKVGTYPDVFTLSSNIYLAARIMQIDDKNFDKFISKHEEFNDFIEFGHVNTSFADLILSRLSERGYLNDEN